MLQTHPKTPQINKNSIVQSCKSIHFIFVVVLLIQVATLLFFCFKKQDFHIDEIYTYILSNGSSLPEVATSESVWNNWTDNQQFTDLVSVQPEERFSYGDVYTYNSLDAHPPLYYFFLHTICSFFPNAFSKWFGLGLNIALFVFTQLSLFCLSKKIFKDTLWSVVPCAFWGGTKIGLESFTFIRMYSFLVLFTTLLLYLHYEMLHREKRTDFLWCFIVTFLGTFTQYYFAITAFFIAAFFCFYLLYKKAWKNLFFYAISMLSAIVCVFLFYPAAISQITGSSTNNVGNAVWGHMLDFSTLFASSLRMGKQLLIGIGSGLWACKEITFLVIFVFIAFSFLFKKSCDTSEMVDSAQSIPLLLVSSLIFFLNFLTVTHISNEFVYDRYIYNIIPLFALCTVLAIKLLIERFPVNQHILVFGMVVIWLISSISLAYHNKNNYLFQDKNYTNTAVVELCKDKPLVIVCSSRCDVHMLTGNYTILLNCEQMYVTEKSDPDNISDILSAVDCSNGVVFMVITDQYWSNGLNGDMLMTDYVTALPQLNSFLAMTECDFGFIYVAE